MSDYTFPEDRFVEAGGTPDEVDTLRREFNSSDVTIQRSQSGYWASGSTGRLRDYLATARESGKFSASKTPPRSTESTLERDSGDSSTSFVENDSPPDDDPSDDDSV